MNKTLDEQINDYEKYCSLANATNTIHEGYSETYETRDHSQTIYEEKTRWVSTGIRFEKDYEKNEEGKVGLKKMRDETSYCTILYLVEKEFVQEDVDEKTISGCIGYLKSGLNAKKEEVYLEKGEFRKRLVPNSEQRVKSAKDAIKLYYYSRNKKVKDLLKNEYNNNDCDDIKELIKNPITPEDEREERRKKAEEERKKQKEKLEEEKKKNSLFRRILELI